MLKVQAQAQADQMRAQTDIQIAQMKAEVDTRAEEQRRMFEAQLAAEKLAREEQFNKWKSELESATKIMVARISANPGLDIPMMEAQQAASEKITSELGDHVKQAIDSIAIMHNDMANKHGETMQNINGMMQLLAAPKRIVRGPDGKALGVEVQVQ
jgi:hypothetical protein